jgi:hypothetical protein
MTIQGIIDELENVVEQAIDDMGIGKDAIVEALTDLIREAKGNDMDYIYDDDFISFEETDFSKMDY